MKETAQSVAIEILSKDLFTVKETEVRDLTAAMDVIPESVAVLSQTHMRQIEEKQLRTERKTTVKETLQILFFLLADEAAIGEIVGNAIAIWIVPIAAAAIALRPAKIEIDEIEREMMRGIGPTGGEVTPEEALMSFLMVTKNPAETGDEGLTVTLKVRVAEEILRFVAHLNI